MTDHPGRVIDGVDFYWGANAGQKRKALAKNDAPHVMTSYITQSNQPLPNKHNPHPYTLWWDCGGSPHGFLQGRLSETGDYVTSDAEYLQHVIDADEDQYVERSLFSLRDYPCETSILSKHGRTVREHQDMTTDRHRSLLNLYDDRATAVEPVSVVQGWHVDDYLRHLDELRDAGCLTDYVAVGSVCAREDVYEVGRILVAVADAVPDSVDVHAFGIKGDALQFREVVDAVTSADSAAYDVGMSTVPSMRADGQSYTWHDAVNAWSSWRTRLAHKMGTETLGDASTRQLTAEDFA